MAVVLSLLSALAYGISDFLGGVFSKRSGPWQVGVVGQSSSTLANLVVGLIIGGTVTGQDWAWAAAAGVGGGIGTAFLYRGLAGARMGVVAPLSAVGTALLPVAVGLATGDRPSTLAVFGVVCAFPAIWLISLVTDEDPSHRGGVIDGILAGLGFGLLFACLGRIHEDAGILPLALTQLVSVGAIIVTAVAFGQKWVPRDRLAYRAVLMGPLGAAATGCFLFATHHGLLSVVAVISALYPASTVLLASLVLKERIQAWQGVGLALAAAAVTLVAIA